MYWLVSFSSFLFVLIIVALLSTISSTGGVVVGGGGGGNDELLLTNTVNNNNKKKKPQVFSISVKNEHNEIISRDQFINSMNSTTTLVLIHIAKKHYHTRLLKLRETWLQDQLVPSWATVLFYTTKEDGPVPGPFATILVDTNEKPHDGNEQILSSLALAYRLIFEKSSSLQWVLKVDDDTYLSWSSLAIALTTKDSEKPHYIGDCDCTSPDWTDAGRGCGVDYDCSPLEGVPSFKYVCGGSGVLMSKPALKLLVREETTRHCLRTLEDITLGHCLLSSNVVCEEMSFTAFLSLKSFGQRFLQSASDEDFMKVCAWEVTKSHEYDDLHNRYMKLFGLLNSTNNVQSNTNINLR